MSAKILDEITEEFLVCKICFEDYKKPKVLPCLHTFCEGCLVKYVPGKARNITCPLCREETALPDNGVAGLKGNFLISSLREKLRTGNMEKAGAADDGDTRCHSHGDCPVRFYCEPCEIPVCAQCVKKDHKTHKHVFMSDVVTEKREHLSELLLAAREKVPVFETAIRQLSEAEDSKREERERVESEVISTAEKVVAAIQQQQDYLLTMLDSIYLAEHRELQEEKDRVETELVSLRSSCDFTEKVLQFGNDAEILSVTNQMTGRLQKLSDVPLGEDLKIDSLSREIRYVMRDDDMSWVAEKMGHVECHMRVDRHSQLVEEIEKTIEKFSKPSSGMDLARDPENPASPKKVKPSERRPTSLIPNGVPELEDEPLWAKSNAPFAGATLLLQTEAPSAGLRPCGVAVRGEMDIVVADSDSMVVQVFSSLTGNLRHTFNVDIYPKDVAITPEGNIAILGCDGSIKLCTPQGRLFRHNDSSGVVDPVGLAVDSNGRFVISDADGHQVKVLNPNGTPAFAFGGYGDDDTQFDDPSYVAVNHRNDIIVSDEGNHCIKVFDSSGKFLRRFGTQGEEEGQFDHPKGVCADSHGNILVADWLNNRVALFSSDGQFQRYIVASTDRLRRPCAVALISDWKLVVSEYNNSRVKVFRF
ncbi:PREDICTED: tripartite motif-containing protein 3-like [Branchiostoma belcheri]|uniref:RING-type E3 ubiquitin transferase n=1 Tax=Branchiostoma belcheri TaxID=7741 RepID=A0A6P5AZ42_BRABE|nr:PREDICTED: tripartite motif-containing protein 3-like [Branchiostoma belcheri]